MSFMSITTVELVQDQKKKREKTDQVYFKKIAGAYLVLILTSRYWTSATSAQPPGTY
jgi:hypothetical protein